MLNFANDILHGIICLAIIGVFQLVGLGFICMLVVLFSPHRGSN